MESCEVLIVGGGPAGSSCAAGLVAAGLDVLLLDRAVFPRSKPCAGWITPAVPKTLAIDLAEYAHGRVLQAISGFRTSMIGGPEVVTRYDQVVSYGIRRDEFDDYLLQRSGVSRQFGEGVTRLERQDGGWLVNGRIKARLLVGAGGHFCPVARTLGAGVSQETEVVARVTEEVLSPEQMLYCRTAADTPALFFSPDLQGYGWLLRKGNFLNVGFGRRGQEDFSRHFDAFNTFLVARGELPVGFASHFHGHAYRLYDRYGAHRCVDEGVLLIGDAAGLAGVHSGEGIFPAIQSGQFAAATILAAQGDYRRATLESYVGLLINRRGGEHLHLPTFSLPSGVVQRLGAYLLATPWSTRHLILNRWFLHLDQPGLLP